MKKIFSIAAVLFAVAALITSCGDDKIETGNGGNNGGNVETKNYVQGRMALSNDAIDLYDVNIKLLSSDSATVIKEYNFKNPSLKDTTASYIDLKEEVKATPVYLTAKVTPKVTKETIDETRSYYIAWGKSIGVVSSNGTGVSISVGKNLTGSTLTGSAIFGPTRKDSTITNYDYYMSTIEKRFTMTLN